MIEIDTRLPERFRSRVVVDRKGCWLWTGARNANGYGSFAAKSTRPVRTMLAHRYAWSVLRGPVPSTLDHLCHQRTCVNPAHLRPATAKQNAENLAGARRDSTSGIRGVRFNRWSWEVRVRHNGVLHEQGGYATAEEAERAAIALRLELYGPSHTERVGGTQ